MSRGLGRVGRAIKAVFEAAPDDAFTVEELCRLIYPGISQVEKKHRVAVIRAAFRLYPWLMSIYPTTVLVAVSTTEVLLEL
jgi:hypothetical protein